MSCEPWDDVQSQWVLDSGKHKETLLQLAWAHLIWTRLNHMPAGGIMSTLFTDASHTDVLSYGNRRDPAIWTGAYLAAEALRFIETGSRDAELQLAETVRTISRWWRISGDPGYLARFAAPADSSSPVLETLSETDTEVIRDVPFEGKTWHWRGRISRDQYQGIMLGMSLAYEATKDPGIKKIIRDDVLRFAEQLIRVERKRIKVIINESANFSTILALQHAVYSEAETPDGVPILRIRTDPFEAEGSGIVVFWPNPTEIVRQVPGLGLFPEVLLPSQAIQLGSIFSVALQVTEGIAGYESQHQALKAHYDSNFERWLDIAKRWENTNVCGSSYHGLNIAFIPAFNWLRLESDPSRKSSLQRDVLRDGLWSSVASHKNVLFAFIYSSQAHPEDRTHSIVDSHLDQLALFPPAPQVALARDLRGNYPEDPDCPGLSVVAVDVDERVPATFIWERHPWQLYAAGDERQAFAGVDYLLAYWLGRNADFIAGDPPTCLRWRIGVQGSATLPVRGSWRGILDGEMTP